MAEPVTTIGIGAIAAYLGKDGLSKLLGPTADYLGSELKVFTEKRIENVGRIFKSAEDKLGSDISENGSVPPKVLKTIINEGSYSSESLAVEYFGGVLASSRTEIDRDDRGARIARQLDNLSSYQLRSHYIIYSTIAKTCDIGGEALNNNAGRRKCQILMPVQEYAEAMEFTQQEWGNPQLLSHIFQGLSADGLIAATWGFGPSEHLQQYLNNGQLKLEDDFIGLVCEPTISGIELFLWGFGKGECSLNDIFESSFHENLLEDIKPIDNAVQSGK
ncbi:hypothetical protein [Pseudoalteromonas ruthenica]|uniref:hypothetical protein n=1 Tax=Pseudoalteromonas ruthenica TaxID=151081 RepID=UPI0005FA2F4B|nr:hypothetical protein [Pseudoalteromonas ruthenica]TMO86487.1 hypothetical protein CWC12_13800 [Pseudoalteromonas ruthenica]TMO91166.1 hypothetical protein CWC13_16465 [Pseudoalteromonas ruthenica]TMP01808.1 hypothetical protein CWC07_00175 [Pseudoalteromonas ruthenica]TMP05079.1 hypothetical protein CWC09_14345 [Pseudoalteromonas ruthenica]TMP10993.1 hypothetical protein CWC08_06310 [Pseudoalteromonas ruthenica]